MEESLDVVQVREEEVPLGESTEEMPEQENDPPAGRGAYVVSEPTVTDDDLSDTKVTDFFSHCFIGNQQQLNMIFFSVGNETFCRGKCLDLKRKILFLVQIIHKIESIIHLQITDCKYVFLQYTPPA